MHPYRQDASVVNMRTPFIVPSGGTLHVEKSRASLIFDLQQEFKKDEMQKYSGVIDFSGKIPAFSFIVGSKPVGVAWYLNNNYSTEVFRLLADNRFCKNVRRALIITQTSSPVSTNPDILAFCDISFISDYKLRYRFPEGFTKLKGMLVFAPI